MKKWFWIFLAVFTGIVGLCCVKEPSLWMYVLLILGIDLLSVFFYFVVPRWTLGKSKVLDATVRYSFDRELITMESECVHAKESSEVRYTIIKKVAKNGNDLYLFISSIQAYVVDLSSLSEQSVANLKAVLYHNVKPSKIKWRD